MTVSFSIPNEIEQHLRREFVSVDDAMKEAAFVELYRQGKISHGQIANALGISRYETDAVLKRHGVSDDLISVEELGEQVAVLQERLDR